MTEWMTNLPADKTSKPLINLCIPGSHDSFTYSLDPKQPIGNDDPDLKPFGIFPIVKEIILRWSKTQKLTVTDQLNLGIRYFDFRVSRPNNATVDDLKIVHGLYGDKVSDILLEIVEFSTAHPKETILLDFNHFYNFDGATHTFLLNLISTVMDTKLVPRKQRYSDLTLDGIWAQGQAFVVIYHGPDVPTSMWPANAIQSPWPNTDKLDKLTSYLDGKLQERMVAGSAYSKKFFVTQGILTIRLRDIIATGGLGSLESNVALKTTARMVQWIAEVKGRLGSAFNIFIVDFVNMDNYASVVISLNQ